MMDGEGNTTTPAVERRLQDAGLRRRVVPVALHVVEGLGDEVVPAEPHAGGDPPLVEVRVEVVELPVQRLLLLRREVAVDGHGGEVAVGAEEALDAEVEHLVGLGDVAAPHERVGHLAVVARVLEARDLAARQLVAQVEGKHPVG